MKNRLLQIWRAIKMPLIIALILVVIGFAIFNASKLKNQACKGLIVQLIDEGNQFISVDEIEKLVVGSQGDNIEGEILSELQLKAIEKTIASNAYVADARTYVGIDNSLKVKVRLKQAVLRIINSAGVHYYIARNGDVMPVSANFTPRVLVANGAINLQNNQEIHKQLIEVSEFLAADEFWNSLVDQIYVNRQQELELIPKFGANVIVMGKMDNRMSERFRKLKIFYQDGLKYVGWNKYKIINLKYENQVVCTKI